MFCQYRDLQSASSLPHSAEQKFADVTSARLKMSFIRAKVMSGSAPGRGPEPEFQIHRRGNRKDYDDET